MKKVCLLRYFKVEQIAELLGNCSQLEDYSYDDELMSMWIDKAVFTNRYIEYVEENLKLELSKNMEENLVSGLQ